MQVGDGHKIKSFQETALRNKKTFCSFCNIVKASVYKRKITFQFQKLLNSTPYFSMGCFLHEKSIVTFCFQINDVVYVGLFWLVKRMNTLKHVLIN